MDGQVEYERQLEGEDKRPDLIVTLPHAAPIAIDVSCTVNDPARRETEKKHQYKRYEEVSGIKMVPFVLNALGRMGAEGQNLINKWARARAAETGGAVGEKEARDEYRQRVATRLQSGNAAMVLEGKRRANGASGGGGR